MVFLKLQRRNVFVFITDVNMGFLYPVRDPPLSCLSEAVIKHPSVPDPLDFIFCVKALAML